MAADKRKYERFPLRLRGKVAANESGNGDPIDVVTTDVSSGGAFFHTTKPLAIGSRVKLTIFVASKTLNALTGTKGSMRAAGTVVRSSIEGMAVCFSQEPELIPVPVS